MNNFLKRSKFDIIKFDQKQKELEEKRIIAPGSGVISFAFFFRGIEVKSIKSNKYIFYNIISVKHSGPHL